RQETKFEIAKELFADGADRTKIKRYTGLSDADLDTLLH
ncbi:hypothetical protein Rin_00023060, partial [Candidatus Regiella insecticola 5.15]